MNGWKITVHFLQGIHTLLVVAIQSNSDAVLMGMKFTISVAVKPSFHDHRVVFPPFRTNITDSSVTQPI